MLLRETIGFGAQDFQVEGSSSGARDLRRVLCLEEVKVCGCKV